MMTRKRERTIRSRIVKIEAQCDSCCNDEPPWTEIYEALNFVHELLHHVGAIRKIRKPPVT